LEQWSNGKPKCIRPSVFQAFSNIPVVQHSINPCGGHKIKDAKRPIFSRSCIISETFKIDSGGRGAGRAAEKQVFAKPSNI